MDALSQKGASDESVARLLFHEATHKWANTKDICYKWDTIAQKYKHTEWNKAITEWRTDKARTLATKIRDNIQLRMGSIPLVEESPPGSATARLERLNRRLRRVPGFRIGIGTVARTRYPRWWR
jgi:hypothetical protein